MIGRPHCRDSVEVKSDASSVLELGGPRLAQFDTIEGVCHCLADPGGCLLAWLLPCVAAALVARDINENPAACFLLNCSYLYPVCPYMYPTLVLAPSYCPPWSIPHHDKRFGPLLSYLHRSV